MDHKKLVKQFWNAMDNDIEKDKEQHKIIYVLPLRALEIFFHHIHEFKITDTKLLLKVFTISRYYFESNFEYPKFRVIKLIFEFEKCQRNVLIDKIPDNYKCYNDCTLIRPRRKRFSYVPHEIHRWLAYCMFPENNRFYLTDEKLFDIYFKSIVLDKKLHKYGAYLYCNFLLCNSSTFEELCYKYRQTAINDNFIIKIADIFSINKSTIRSTLHQILKKHRFYPYFTTNIEKIADTWIKLYYLTPLIKEDEDIAEIIKILFYRSRNFDYRIAQKYSHTPKSSIEADAIFEKMKLEIGMEILYKITGLDQESFGNNIRKNTLKYLVYKKIVDVYISFIIK